MVEARRRSGVDLQQKVKILVLAIVGIYSVGILAKFQPKILKNVGGDTFYMKV